MNKPIMIDPQLINNFRTPAFPGSYFLSFEGIEGAGKSTQIKILKDFLEQKTFRVLVLREPGGTIFGEKLRQAILSSKQKLHPIAEAHLFASSRAQLMHEVTLKELNIPGTIVIYDRYLESSLAYQGKARGVGIENILKLHQVFPLNLVPHLTFFLKIGVEYSQGRQKIRNAPKDYFEAENESFYQKLIEGYEEAMQLFPERVVAINGERDVHAVSADIQKQTENLIFNQ